MAFPLASQPERKQASALITMLQAFQRGLSLGRAPIEPLANGYDFIMRYKPKAKGGHPIQFDDWEHLVELYQDNSRFIVLMAGAQTGKTEWLFTHILRRMLLEYGSMFGYYVPTDGLANSISDDRYGPFLRSMTEVAPLLGMATSDGRGVDATRKKSIGASIVHFMTSNGVSSTESMPLKGIYLDEVRRMEEGDIERIQQRYSAQVNPVDVKVSTAGYPGRTIHSYFLQGSQKYFHTETDHPDGYVLSKNFPDCILDLRNASAATRRKVEEAFKEAKRPLCNMTEEDRKQYPLACYHDHRTGFIITNPRNGWWEAENPNAFIASYQMPQMLSPMWPAGRVLGVFENAKDKQEFYNSCLGLPHVDDDKRPVKDAHLLACVNPALTWPARESQHWRRKNLRNTCMGVDVQDGYLIAVIKGKTPNGKGRLLHLEVVYQGTPGRVGDDPWERLAELMIEYDVRIAVVDRAPQTNEALRFARRFPGRVWLAVYTGGASALSAWGDVRKKQGKKQGRQADSARRFNVRINRTVGLQWSLGRWSGRMNEMPPPDKLFQTLPTKSDGMPALTARLSTGEWREVAVSRDLFWWHQKCIIFEDVYAPGDMVKHGGRKVTAASLGKSEIKAVHVECDPHFAHSNLYCDVALDRMINGAKGDDGEDLDDDGGSE